VVELCAILNALWKKLRIVARQNVIWSEWFTGQGKVCRHSCNPSWNTN